ncbi:hypothetical protein [Winogradskyella sp.]|uniref:hypothetical protein n=1 Tax=Winogradskyella sp. TaxID=1883156 RepID=UPI002617D15E|nr:hypothetical protein [Winogradskyella sp.]
MNKNIITSVLLTLLIFPMFAQKEVSSNIDQYRNKGYFNITKFGYIFVGDATLETFSPEEGVVVTSLPTDKAGAFTLHTINGYFFNPYFSLGLGFGLDGYRNPRYNTLPVYLDLRGYFNDALTSPYAFLNYGTLVKIENGPKNGNMFNIGVGYKLPLNDDSRFVLVGDIAYSYKAVSNDGESIRNSNSYVRLKGVMLSIGVMF